MPEKKFFTAKHDRIFKTIFFDNDNYSLLEELLSFLLNREVKVEKILNNELGINHSEEKVKILDSLIELTDGYVNIEVNSNADKEARNKAFNYRASFYSKFTKRSKKYSNSKQFINIDLAYGLSLKDPIVRTYPPQDIKTKDLYVENFIIIEYNMDRIINYWYQGNKRMINKYLKLIVQDLPKEELLKIEKKGGSFVKTVKEKIISLNEDEWYKPFLTREEDEEFMKNTYIDKGMTLGLEQGMTKGIEQEKNSIARNALKNGFNVDQVATITNMSIAEVKKLERSIKMATL